jgi:hypothetical protein
VLSEGLEVRGAGQLGKRLSELRDQSLEALETSPVSNGPAFAGNRVSGDDGGGEITCAWTPRLHGHSRC